MIAERVRNGVLTRVCPCWQRPLLNAAHIDIDRLNGLPANTLGGAYARYLSMHGFELGKRPPVKLILDPELAFVMQRYRDTHDLLHTVFGVPVSVSGEVALKWFEMVQTGLPMTVLAAFFGGLRAEASLVPSQFFPGSGMVDPDPATQEQ